MVLGQPTVRVCEGILRGRNNTTQTGYEYLSFQGIRYAQPPVGELRFKPSLPPDPWTGIYDATKEGNRSLSLSPSKEIIGDEDCLFLNVYTQKLLENEGKSRPVMFWIHGGGLYTGCGNEELYSPDFLITEEVVIVTVNYRLGLLGGLQFDDPEINIKGNAVLWDIVLALRWVQKNIVHFNGNPSNVTIFGESAGSILIHEFLTCTMATGLFAKAICQSGVSIGGPHPDEYPKGPFVYAEACGCKTQDEMEAYECLRNQSGANLVHALDHVVQNSRGRYDKPFYIVPDPPILDETSQPSDFDAFYQRRFIANVPLLIGFNSMDGMVYATKEFGDKFVEPTFTNPELTIPSIMCLQRGTKKSIQIAKEITNYYYGNESPSRRNIDKFCQYETDIRYALPIMKTVEAHQAANTCPIYLYKFCVDSPHNLYKKFFGLNVPGAGHGDELTYLFKTKYTPKFRPGSLEDRTKYRMVKFWTNFAKYSDPNPRTPDPQIPARWEPVRRGEMNHLNIGKTLVALDEAPNQKSVQFWEELYRTLDEE